MFQTYRGKAILQQHQIITSTKNPANFENIREESSEFEQKPIKKFNECSDGEEEELKQQAEKRKQTRRDQSQESKSKKLKLKQEEVKEKESKMWEQFNDLNSKFKTIKQAKKDAKKMSATIL